MLNLYKDLMQLKIWSKESSQLVTIKDTEDGKAGYSLQIGNSHETHFFITLSPVEEHCRCP